MNRTGVLLRVVARFPRLPRPASRDVGRMATTFQPVLPSAAVADPLPMILRRSGSFPLRRRTLPVTDPSRTRRFLRLRLRSGALFGAWLTPYDLEEMLGLGNVIAISFPGGDGGFIDV